MSAALCSARVSPSGTRLFLFPLHFGTTAPAIGSLIAAFHHARCSHGPRRFPQLAAGACSRTQHLWTASGNLVMLSRTIGGIMTCLSKLKSKIKDPKPNYDYETDATNLPAMQPYAHKFWESANQVVALIYAAAFGVYLALSQGEKALAAAREHVTGLCFLAIAGNAGLVVLLVRMAVHEYRFTRKYSNDPVLIDGVWSAMHMRIALVLINLGIYLYVILWVIASAG
ncbi:hypothetical protein [Rhizobium sp. Rhizsp82]|uniref:hypothetical protein n=1 Tax=Rhizobium sp. Rhizsp82 TaxID=3243057 RepID=UPI0039B6485D